VQWRHGHTLVCASPRLLLLLPLPQVHLATLKSGEKVVVKVQRPGLKALFDIDLKNIRWGPARSHHLCKRIQALVLCLSQLREWSPP
jgi:hypothetical protein